MGPIESVGQVTVGHIPFHEWSVGLFMFALLMTVGVVSSAYIHEWVRQKFVRRGGGTRSGTDPWIDRFIAAEEKIIETNSKLAEVLAHFSGTQERVLEQLKHNGDAFEDLAFFQKESQSIASEQWKSFQDYHEKESGIMDRLYEIYKNPSPFLCQFNTNGVITELKEIKVELQKSGRTLRNAGD